MGELDEESGFQEMKIGVLMGGLSREREISLKTGAAILKAFRRKDIASRPLMWATTSPRS